MTVHGGIDLDVKLLYERIDQFLLEEYLIAPGSVSNTTVKVFLERHGCDCDLLRFRRWLLSRLGSTRSRSDLPDLRCQPYWSRDDVSWLSAVAGYCERIASEWSRSGLMLQAYREPLNPDGRGLTDGGQWQVCYLYLNHKRFTDRLALLPSVVELVEGVLPRHYNHCFISVLPPCTRILPHRGPSNHMLRLWLPLTGAVAGQTWLKVGGEEVGVDNGQPLLWDHSFEHEAGHGQAPGPRVVLIADIWHPDLSNAEVRLLSLLQRTKLRVLEKSLDPEQYDQSYFKLVEGG
jgi:hypothetical protein